MALVNRDKDASEQKDVVTVTLGATATGVTAAIWIAPYPCTVQSARAVCTGISGAPIISFFKSAAAGITLEAIGISGLVVASLGTSGVLGFSGLAAAGSTLLDFASNGVLSVTTTGSNAAFVNAVIELVVKKTQDIVAHNGVSS